MVKVSKHEDGYYRYPTPGICRDVELKPVVGKNIKWDCVRFEGWDD